MPEWTDLPECGNIRLKQRKKQRAPIREPLELAATTIAVAVMIGTSAAETYTPGKLIAFGISIAWVVFYMIKRR